LSIKNLEADYLVVGAGAMGLAFADELIRSNTSVQLIIVDKHAKPGGHWNDAYPFVSLHQPSAFYGVNSIGLGSGGSSLATGAELLAYFETVLTKLLATGQVQYFSMCEYQGEGVFSSIVTHDQQYKVRVRKKIVDSTYMKVQVPSTTPPKYAVAPGVNLVPLNKLSTISQPVSNYVVIGAGKTGIDAIIFLIAQGVPPDNITWVVSNDSWLMERNLIQPGMTLNWFVSQLDTFTKSKSLDEIYSGLEAKNVFFRIDEQIRPSKFRCATVSQDELAKLRLVKNVVRKGRVKSIDANEIILAQGRVPVSDNTLFVDCTANPLAKQASVPVFEGDTITLQSLLMCQQVFSASVIAHVENRFSDEQQKNALCMPVPHPEQTQDYVAAMAGTLVNVLNWERKIGFWLLRSRLSFMYHENLFSVLFRGYQAKRLTGPAIESLRLIFSEQFPGRGFPGDNNLKERFSEASPEVGL